jgi:hypothetical protein
MSRVIGKSDFGPTGFHWLTLKRITVTFLLPCNFRHGFDYLMMPTDILGCLVYDTRRYRPGAAVQVTRLVLNCLSV